MKADGYINGDFGKKFRELYAVFKNIRMLPYFIICYLNHHEAGGMKIHHTGLSIVLS